MLNILFLITGSALADRFRGMPVWSSPVKAALYSLFPAFTLDLIGLGSSIPILLLFILAFIAGESMRWGEALGSSLKGTPMIPKNFGWWQFGVFKTDSWKALTFRGFLWGLPFITLAYWEPIALLMIPAFTVAMPLAVWLVNKLPAKALEDDEEYAGRKWERQEPVRGALLILILVFQLQVLQLFN